MRLFFQWIQENISKLLLVLFCNMLLGVSFYLYGLKTEVILYPLFLCDATVLIYSVYQFFSYRKRYLQIHNIHNPQYAESSFYPIFINQIEKEEYRLITELKEQIQENEYRNEKETKDMIDYYTVWVHQIKTPIAAMKLHLQNEDSPLSRSLQTDLFHIEQYVEMVLAYLRLSSKQTDYLFQSYDIDSLLKSVIRKFADEFIERRITLDYQPVHMHAVTDEKWLRFVLEQVLSNALKYTPEGTIHIYGISNDSICIEDTGIGINREDLPRIFENGFTGYNGRLSPQASGIGLYLCKKICENLSHSIEASSTPGKGTKITIHLHQNENLSQM